ncbi:hypothetical protein BT96DRAFT_946759 [Gymnopus androsaceus JB14]|uniref:Uncharacterized protein n=1 Tax=Gymnopus androsaceus JB14 TaxID=1447944 RepID=A0A6A4GWX9_9AGAR|nr:hypothetical protein BT96DRAFT_946759 [Gymnopus androsaceus JB14]
MATRTRARTSAEARTQQQEETSARFSVMAPGSRRLVQATTTPASVPSIFSGTPTEPASEPPLPRYLQRQPPRRAVNLIGGQRLGAMPNSQLFETPTQSRSVVNTQRRLFNETLERSLQNEICQQERERFPRSAPRPRWDTELQRASTHISPYPIDFGPTTTQQLMAEFIETEQTHTPQTSTYRNIPIVFSSQSRSVPHSRMGSRQPTPIRNPTPASKSQVRNNSPRLFYETNSREPSVHNSHPNSESRNSTMSEIIVVPRRSSIQQEDVNEMGETEVEREQEPLLEFETQNRSIPVVEMTEFSRLRTPIAQSTPTTQRHEPWEGYREQYREIMSKSPESLQIPSMQANESEIRRNTGNEDSNNRNEEINALTPSFMNPHEGYAYEQARPIPTTLGMGDVEFAEEHLLNLGGRAHFFLRRWGVERDPHRTPAGWIRVLLRLGRNRGLSATFVASMTNTDNEELFEVMLDEA